MADLQAKFSLVDLISDKLTSIADAGQRMLEQFDRAEDAASSAMDNIASSSSAAVSTVDGIAKSLDEMNRSADSAKAPADDLAGAFTDVEQAAESAAGASDSIGEIAGSAEQLESAAAGAGNAASTLSDATDEYSSAAEQAASSTDSLSDSVEALEKSSQTAVQYADQRTEAAIRLMEENGQLEESFHSLEEAQNLCGETMAMLCTEIAEATVNNQALSDSIQQTNGIMDSMQENSSVTSEQLEKLADAEKSAEDSLQALQEAQREADSAYIAFCETLQSGTTNLNELEDAADRANQAAEALAEANLNASSASEQLAKATQDVSDSADKAGESGENAGKTGTEAVEQIAQALAAAGITAKVKEIAEGVYELVDAFSDAEKIVVNATGATGAALDGLEESMMQAYTGHHQGLEDTAGAIGEINTRMGLTGKELTDVTGKFLDFASITGSDVVSSVQNATKIMNKWGVEQENVESVLDKLAYAGQVSGASVDDLSRTLITGSAAFQEMGLSLDNTISLLSAFELYGMNSTTAITAMRTAVKNFSDDGIDASEGLRTTISQIQNMESAAEATALAVEVFGARAGVDMANAIRNGAITVEMLNGDLEQAQGTLKTTAEASETLSEKWEKSNNKIKAAFTSAVEPTINKFSSSMADLTGKFGDFLGEHPALTKALTALGVGLGVVTLGIAGVAFATSSAIPAIVTFATTINLALGPIGWIALGVTAAAAAIAAFAAMSSNAEEAVEEYNGTMEECAAEISRTEAAYEKACAMYGENSAAALELSDTLSTLNKQYEMGGGDLAVYAEKAEALAESFKQMSDSQKKAMDEIGKSETSGMTAVAMLSALSEQTSHTSADLDLMGQYADYLNQEFDCDIHVNYSTGELTGFDPQVVVGAVIDAANDQRYQKAMKYLSGADFQDNYINAKKNVTELTGKLEEANAKRNELYEKRGNLSLALDDYPGKQDWEISIELDKEIAQIDGDIDSLNNSLSENQSVLRAAEAEIDSYGQIIDDTGKFAETFKTTLDEMATATDSAAQSTADHTEKLSESEQGAFAAQEAWKQYESEIMALCEAYDAAYQAAYESIHGQFGLFDEASTKSEEYVNSTVANAQAALDSQLAYWTSYSANIEALKNTSAADLGITQQNYDALMAYVQDGSEQAAGLASSMVNAIESGNTEAVSKLANTLGEVNAKQSEISSAVADWQTGFSSQMDAILSKMTSTVTNLNMSDEANAAATATMTAYASAITTAGDSAVTAAQNIANRVKAALNSASTTINVGVSGNVPGHAAGTTNAEDVFIAGEKGPELIVGQAGSTVFPASETNKILHAMQELDAQAGGYGNTYRTDNFDNRAYPRYLQQTDSETVNNITTYNTGTGYDDAKLLYLLSGFVSVLSSIDKKIQPQSASQPEPQPIVVDAYSTGTTDSDDTFIAGENGPELIIGQPDSTVFPAEETEKIVTVLTGGDDTVSDGLAKLAKAITPAAETVSNYEQTFEYGDTAFTHSYNTEYGDTNSYITDVTTEYGDSYSTDEGDVSTAFDRNYESILNRSESNVSQTLSDDHSSAIENATASYSTMTQNASQSFSEGDRAITDTDISNRYGTAYETAYSYGDTIQNYTETAMPVTDSSHAFQNDITAVFIPPLELFTAMIEKALREPQDAISETQTGQETAVISFEPPVIGQSAAETGIIEAGSSDRPTVIGGDADQDESESRDKNPDRFEANSEKRIVIEIAGSGKIDITDGVDREQVLELMQDNLKPVLMDIIQGEIFEEGERAYDY